MEKWSHTLFRVRPSCWAVGWSSLVCLWSGAVQCFSFLIVHFIHISVPRKGCQLKKPAALVFFIKISFCIICTNKREKNGSIRNGSGADHSPQNRFSLFIFVHIIYNSPQVKAAPQFHLQQQFERSTGPTHLFE